MQYLPSRTVIKAGQFSLHVAGVKAQSRPCIESIFRLAGGLVCPCLVSLACKLHQTAQHQPLVGTRRGETLECIAQRSAIGIAAARKRERQCTQDLQITSGLQLGHMGAIDGAIGNVLVQSVEVITAQGNLGRSLIPQQIAGLVADELQRLLITGDLGLARHGDGFTGRRLGLTMWGRHNLGTGGSWQWFTGNLGLDRALQIGHFRHHCVQLAHCLL